MNTILPIVQIVISVLLAVLILIQQKGTGLSSAFGGDGNIYRTKRGLEKGIYYATIVLIVFFLGTAVINILI